MDWSPILTTAGFTGLATAVLNQTFGWWRESRGSKRERARDAAYVASRFAVILERFALDCAESISAQDMHRTSGGHAGRASGTLPELPELPDQEKWSSLSPVLLSRALSLQNELILSDRAIAFWLDVDRECIPNECDQQCGKCGYEAWRLAEDLRRHYRLGVFDPSRTSWDVVGTLRTHHDEAQRQIADRRARHLATRRS